MNLTKALTKKFKKHPVTFYRDETEELWVTADELGQALGYADPRRSVLKVFQRNRDILEPFQGVVNLSTPGGVQQVRVFNEIGANIIAMKSTTRKAKEFVVWAAFIIREYRRGNLVDRRKQDKLPSAAFITELRRTVGQGQAALIISRLLGTQLPPIHVVETRLRDMGLGWENICEGLGYDRFDIRKMRVDVNMGRFERKEELAAAVGLRVSDIWGIEG